MAPFPSRTRLPPRFVRRDFTFKVDMWTRGVTVYYMLCGEMPSFGDDFKVAGTTRNLRSVLTQLSWRIT